MDVQSNHFEVAIDRAKKSLESNLMYCPECDEYYLRSFFQKTIYKHYADKGALAFSSELTKAIEKEFPCYMCPKGHKIKCEVY